MKEVVKIIMVFYSVFNWGQVETSELIKPRLSFSDNQELSLDKSKYVILNNDTLYAKIKRRDFSIFSSEPIFQNIKLLKRYKALVFRFTNEKSKKVIKLKQWSEPIAIYLDKEIPKNVAEKLKSFYLDLNNLNNLKISFSK
ncbi:MAG: hypothetical protein AAF688_13930, partial [Bacteroidota bacterium]